MRMNFGPKIEIRDLGNHPAVTVISLGFLLAKTVNVMPDPKRKGFYEVQGNSTIYYIWALPGGGTIFLLATWRNFLPPVANLEVAARCSRERIQPELSAK